MTKKKHYKKPVLTIIDLDPKQAIITQCAIGGGWMLSATHLVCMGVGPYGACPISVRGVRQLKSGGSGAQNLTPS